MEHDGCNGCKHEHLPEYQPPCSGCKGTTLFSSAEYEFSPDYYEPINGSPVIKDSGDRTEFTTGAVRDMHTGKGRMDLLPVTAIIELSKHCENGAIKYGERNVDKGIPQHSFIDSGLRHLFKYLRGDKDENHLVAALWNIAWAVEQEVNKPELNDLPNR